MTVADEVCESLAKLLREGGEVVRCHAAQALGRIGNARALDALIACLMDEDADVRADAAEALGLLGGRAAGAALLESLRLDPCPDVKINAIAALGRLGHREATPTLRRLVGGRDESIAWDDTERLSGGWDDWLDIQVKAIEALGELGALDAVPDIVSAIDDEMGQDLTAVGFRALARLGEPGVEALECYLAAQDERVRRQCARALACADFQGVRAALVKALQDSSSDVRAAAARGLATRNPADEQLTALFDDEDPGVRAEAVRLFGRFYPERLDALLDDPSEHVQEGVLHVLGTNPEIRGLADLPDRLRVKLHGPSVDVAVAAAALLAAWAPNVAFESLVEQLRDSGCPNAVRRAAARALADVGMDEAVRELLSVIGDDDRQVRLEAMAGLARIAAAEGGSAVARQALVSALRGELVAPPVAEGAPVSSGSDNAERSARGDESQFGGKRGWPNSTLQAIREPRVDPEVARIEEEGPELTEQDLEYLAVAHRAPRKRRVAPNARVAAHADVPRLAARVLGDFAGADVAQALVAALDSRDTEVRRASAASLTRLAKRMEGLPPDAVGALTVSCADPDRDVRLAAARALGRAGARQAEGALADLLRDRDGLVRGAAARALAALGAAGWEVETLLEDEDPGVRLAAAAAVAEQGGPGALARLVGFAFAYDGMHAREAARLLRDLDRDGASKRVLSTLADPGQKRSWRVAVEILGELHGSDTVAAVQLVA